MMDYKGRACDHTEWMRHLAYKKSYLMKRLGPAPDLKNLSSTLFIFHPGSIIAHPRVRALFLILVLSLIGRVLGGGRDIEDLIVVSPTAFLFGLLLEEVHGLVIPYLDAQGELFDHGVKLAPFLFLTIGIFVFGII